MDDDGTAQHGQAAVGAVAVSWSRTDVCSTVTSVRHTVPVGGSNAVMSVCSSWVIIPYDTAISPRLRSTSPKLTMSQEVLAMFAQKHGL